MLLAGAAQYAGGSKELMAGGDLGARPALTADPDGESEGPAPKTLAPRATPEPRNAQGTARAGAPRGRLLNPLSTPEAQALLTKVMLRYRRSTTTTPMGAASERLAKELARSCA
jgi:hypothetical protein